ncbi:hypothetical protein THAOC_17713, partial [Thalassiosira oceanica]
SEMGDERGPWRGEESRTTESCERAAKPSAPVTLQQFDPRGSDPGRAEERGKLEPMQQSDKEREDNMPSHF